jgi:prepilin-type N-terminal cleavage/methylation domain-containing protein
MRPVQPRHTAFTLIELLVVIAIIAVLISILLPALSAAKVEGQKVKCVSNLRVLGQTAQEYANDDPKSTLGPVHPDAACFSGEGYAEFGGGPGTMDFMGWKSPGEPPPGECPPACNCNNPFDPRTRAFNILIYGPGGIVANTEPNNRSNFEVYQCPGEDFGWQDWPGFGADPRELENPYFKANGTAFRMNNLAFTDGWTVGIYGRPINRIPQTSITLGFFETRVYETLFTNDVWGGLTHGELTGNHRKRGYFCTSYADGHASFMDFGDGTYYNHDNSIPPPNTGRDARGKWGRMDCLPEPLFDPGNG